MYRVAAVTLIPTQPALVEMSKIAGWSKFEKSWMIFSRSKEPELPSIRQIRLAQLSPGK